MGLNLSSILDVTKVLFPAVPEKDFKTYVVP